MAPPTQAPGLRLRELSIEGTTPARRDASIPQNASITSEDVPEMLPELWGMIFAWLSLNFAGKRTLVKLMRVCRVFHDEALPLLIREIKLIDFIVGNTGRASRVDRFELFLEDGLGVGKFRLFRELEFEANDPNEDDTEPRPFKRKGKGTCGSSRSSVRAVSRIFEALLVPFMARRRALEDHSEGSGTSHRPHPVVCFGRIRGRASVCPEIPQILGQRDPALELERQVGSRRGRCS